MKTITLTITANATDGNTTQPLFDPIMLTIQLKGDFSPDIPVAVAITAPIAATEEGQPITDETQTENFELE